MKRLRLAQLAATLAFAAAASIAGCSGGGSGAGGTGPIPTPPPPTTTPTPPPTPVNTASATATVPPCPGCPQATYTHRPVTGVVNSTYTIDSNPRGLAVMVNGTSLGVTPTTYSPGFSNFSFTITITPNNGNAAFTYTSDQTANGNHTVYYNQNADTNGSIGNISASSIARRAESFASVIPNDTPRFRAQSLSGRPIFSSTRVAVHYLVSSLQMGGRRAQDVERFEGVQRAVDIGFVKDGQATRIVNVPTGQTVSSIVARFKSHSEVVAAEPLQLRYPTTSAPFRANDRHFAQTDNPSFPPMYEQWGMWRIGAPNAWAYTHGTPQTGNNPNPSSCTIAGSNPVAPSGLSGVAIAILDTGFDNTHPDLSGASISGVGGNGDAGGVPKVVYGERVLDGTVTCDVRAAQDTDGHGTNVSGIAAADTNNAWGFAGVGFDVSLQVYKIFPDSSNPMSDTGDEAQAIYDAVLHGARVINLSLGGTQDGGFDPVERDAIAYAISQNVVVVAAAGNESASTLDFPAAYDGVISVGASSLNDAPNYKQYSTATDIVASYSNYGPRLTVVAPGGDPPSCESSDTPPSCPGYTGIDALHWIYNIYTRTPLDPSQQCGTSGGTDPNRYDCKALFAGTSQATPHVAGAVGLLLSKNPALTVSQVTQIIEATADDIGDPHQGQGRLNLYRAMAVVSGDNSPPGIGGLSAPSNLNFVAIAYTNSGAINAAPAIVNLTYTKGVPVASDGRFRIADIAASIPRYKCAVWADLNGDGKVDKGDWFGVASGTGSGSSPCSGATNITASPITSPFFTLP